MGEHIALAPALHIPLEAVTSTFGIVGIRGAGKSNTARVMAERFHAARLPFIVIDPVGKWWGIRSSFDGKGPGIPIPILGGRHGDIPLERGAGRLVADLIVENRLSCVLDLFGMGGEDDSEADKIAFLTDFARRLYRRNTEPLHIFMEEADDYIPQQVSSRMARLVGAFEDIVRRGRANGLGCTMITNRTQGLNKAVLEQIESLIIMRTTGPRARKAIEGWVDYHGEKKDILASLPGLKNGEAWIWSPEFLTILKRFQVPRQTTFDSAATPKISKHARPPANLADVDLGAFQVKMAETIERAKATDPKELRRRVSELEAELHRIRAERGVQVGPPQIERVEVAVMTDDDRELMEEVRLDIAHRLEAASREGHALADDIAESSQKFVAAAQRLEAKVTPALPAPQRAAAWDKPYSRAVAKADYSHLAPLRAGERKMLEVLSTRHPVTLTKTQLALLAGSSHKSSTFRAYMGTLKRQGLIEVHGHEVRLTGKAMAGMPSRLSAMSPAETREMWRERLRKGERDIFDAVIAHGIRGISKEALAQRTAASHKSSTFRAYMGTLKRNGLIVVESGLVYAPKELIA